VHQVGDQPRLYYAARSTNHQDTLRSASAQTAVATIASELKFRHSVIQTQAAGIAQSVQ